MYCDQSVDIIVNNPDTPIAAIDMVLTYDLNDIQSVSFDIFQASDYNTPYLSMYDFNASISSDTWKFGGTRTINWPQNAIDKQVGTFNFRNRDLVT